MDLVQLEFAANLIFDLCRQHPELCPHSYSWTWSRGPDENGYYETMYKCGICGNEEIRMEKSPYGL